MPCQKQGISTQLKNDKKDGSTSSNKLNLLKLKKFFQNTF